METVITRTYRMPKQEVVFVDAILESYEGLCSFSVLPLKNGQKEAEMVMSFSASQLAEFEQVIETLQIEQVI